MTRQTLNVVVATLLAAASCGSASAESPLVTSPPPAAVPPPAVPPSVAPAPVGACCHLAAATPVVIELAEEVSTKLQKRGDIFAIRLAEPIVVDGHPLIPAGVTGGGEVVDAAPGGLAGRPGKLILAARYLNYKGVRLPLRAFRLAGTGRDNVLLVDVASEAVGILAVAIPGGNVDFPAGTRAVAKVASDTDLSVLFATQSVQATPLSGTKP